MELVAIIGVALFFNFINGIHGAANIIATMISSRVMHPRTALWLAALTQFCGPFLFGVAIASTIGEKFVDPHLITPASLLASLLGATLWTALTTVLGIPSSSTHALVGGLMGAALAQTGVEALQAQGLLTVLLALLLSPLLGMVGGYTLVKLIYALARHASPSINYWFKRGQLAASTLLALLFASNDGQQIIGVITLGLVLTGNQADFAVATWVIALTAGSQALGTLLGGTTLIRTLGSRLYKIRPVHGLAAQSASALLILITSGIGAPVSGTQVVSSAIVGAGSADRLSKIRWAVFDRIALAWVLTIPASAFTSAVIFFILERLGAA